MSTYRRAGVATYICPQARDAHDEHGRGRRLRDTGSGLLLPDPEADGGGHEHHRVAFLKGDEEYRPPACWCGAVLDLVAVHDWTGGTEGELLHEPGRPPAHEALLR